MTIQLTIDTLEHMLTESARLGGLHALADSGITSGEISQREAFNRFGRRWVETQIANGKLTPCRVGEGRTGVKHYSVAHIQAIRASERIQADIIKTL